MQRIYGVTIDPRREAGIGMPEPVGDDFEVGPGEQAQARRAVSEGVQVDAIELGALEQRHPPAPQKVRLPDDRPGRCGENKVGLGCKPLALS